MSRAILRRATIYRVLFASRQAQIYADFSGVGDLNFSKVSRNYPLTLTSDRANPVEAGDFSGRCQ
jgi:hypothetical protein